MEKLLFAASIGAMLPSLLLLEELQRKFIRELPEQCNAILDSQLLLRPAVIHPHLNCMGVAGRDLYRDFYNFDLFLFPMIYSTFLSGALSRVWPRGSIVWLVPILGALADAMENVSMYFLLLKFPQRYEPLEMAISVFTRTKWLMVALSMVLMMLGGLLRLVEAWRHQKTVQRVAPKAKAA